MRKAELRPINDDNRAQCLDLTVSPQQEAYIAANRRSLEQAAENRRVARPFGIYIGEKMVGFAMFAFDEAESPGDKYWLWRFMIDKDLQGRGYGSAALDAIIRYFHEHGASEITLSTKQSNTRALALYHKFGFQENGQWNGTEIVLKLHLGEAAPAPGKADTGFQTG